MRRPDQEPAYTQGAFGYIAPILDFLGAFSKILPKRKQKDPTAPDFAGALAYVSKEINKNPSVASNFTYFPIIIASTKSAAAEKVRIESKKSGMRKRRHVFDGEKEVSEAEYKTMLSRLLGIHLLNDIKGPEIAISHFQKSKATKLQKFNLRTKLEVSQEKASISILTLEDIAKEKERFRAKLERSQREASKQFALLTQTAQKEID